MSVSGVAGQAAVADTDFQDALAALTGLKDLTLGFYPPENGKQEPDEHLLEGIAPALQRLTRLTASDLAPARESRLRSPCVQDSDLQVLPVTLAKLAVVMSEEAKPATLGHLTAMTELYVEYVAEGDVLPPSLEVLTLHHSHSSSLLVNGGLVHLRVLSLDCAGSVSEVAPAGLPVLSGLESLEIRMQEGGDVASGWFEQLPKLPLKALHFWVDCTMESG